jgi:putative hydrolase of the HAD superfamily
MRQTASIPRGLLLDFGSVISVSVFERHRASERRLGVLPGSLRWQGPLNAAGDSLWQAMQNDRISERDYFAQRARETGELVGETGWDMATFLRRTREEDPNAIVRPQIARLVRRARSRGIRVGILSNELELFWGREYVAGIDLVQEVDAVIDATHTGVVKPAMPAYLQAIKALALEPAQILFVDDQFRNIAGAVAAGLQVQFFDLRDVDGNVAAVAARLRMDG